MTAQPRAQGALSSHKHAFLQNEGRQHDGTHKARPSTARGFECRLTRWTQRMGRFEGREWTKVSLSTSMDTLLYLRRYEVIGCESIKRTSPSSALASPSWWGRRKMSEAIDLGCREIGGYSPAFS